MNHHFLNHLRAWVITMVLTAHDSWLWLCDFYAKMMTTVMISWWFLLGRKSTTRYQLLAATYIGEDVTWLVKQFYATTEIVSPFKLSRWLGKFGLVSTMNDPSPIDLIFLRDGQLCIARIDPNNDVELLTKQPIVDCDISLDHICAAKI